MTGLGEVAFDHFLEAFNQCVSESFVSVGFGEHGKIDIDMGVMKVIRFISSPFTSARRLIVLFYCFFNSA